MANEEQKRKTIQVRVYEDTYRWVGSQISKPFTRFSQALDEVLSKVRGNQSEGKSKKDVRRKST